jgi:hypothetical protein
MTSVFTSAHSRYCFQLKYYHSVGMNPDCGATLLSKQKMVTGWKLYHFGFHILWHGT